MCGCKRKAKVATNPSKATAEMQAFQAWMSKNLDAKLAKQGATQLAKVVNAYEKELAAKEKVLLKIKTDLEKVV